MPETLCFALGAGVAYIIIVGLVTSAVGSVVDDLIGDEGEEARRG